MEKAKITRTKIFAGLLLIGLAGSFVYYEYTERENAKADAELVSIVRNEMNDLHLQNPGHFVYQEIKANHNCNSSELTIVYASDRNEKEICESFLSSVSPQKWQPQHIQQKADFCEDRQVSNSKALFMHNADRTNFLELEVYPNGAAHTHTFMPVNINIETDIKREAAKHGRSFYYLNVRHRGPYDDTRYACSETDPKAYCECLNSTFDEDTYAEMMSHADKPVNH